MFRPWLLLFQVCMVHFVVTLCGFEPFFVNHSHCILIFFLRRPVGPVAEMPETPTHLSLLSDSIMRTPALNELPDHDKEG